MSDRYELGELKRQFSALVIFGEVIDVDYAKKQLKLQEGDLKTGWLPFPFESGRNYRRWRPVALGQQFTAICRDGDPVQGRIIGETEREGRMSPSVDENMDVVVFANGNRIEHNAMAKTMKVVAQGGLDIEGDVRINGGVTSTKDMVADGVSQINHVHEKTASHPISTSGKPKK